MGKKTSETSGDNSGEDPPVPIPNTVVKLLSADDTWREAAWESRTLPVLLKSEPVKVGSLFCFAMFLIFISQGASRQAGRCACYAASAAV